MIGEIAKDMDGWWLRHLVNDERVVSFVPAVEALGGTRIWTPSVDAKIVTDPTVLRETSPAGDGYRAGGRRRSARGNTRPRSHHGRAHRLGGQAHRGESHECSLPGL